VAEAAFAAGAGQIGCYGECGWTSSAGAGTFRGDAGTHPAIGRPGRRESVPEQRWETICPPARLPAVLAAIRAAHPYEEPAVDVIRLVEPAAEPNAGRIGLGRVGALDKPASLPAVLDRIRAACGVPHVQLARPAGRGKTVRTLAVGCGSCGGLFRQAAAAGADLYVTGELRHHDALAAAQAGLAVACVGHSNSERLTLRHLADRVRPLLPALGLKLSRVDRDPFTIV
jgi:hypothetical protein